MKKSLQILFLLLAISVGITKAQTLIFSEEFNYTTGSLLTGNGYTASSGAGTNALAVSSLGLTMTNYPAKLGGAITLATSGEDDFKAFTGVNSGNVYLAFLLNVQSALTGDYFIALSPASTQTNYYARLHIKASGTGFLVGVSKSNEVSGGAAYGTTVRNFNATYLVVVKYAFKTGSTADDAISVYVLSTLATGTTEPATPEVGPYVCADASKTDATDFGYITIRQGSATAASGLMLDGIRIASSWSVAVLNTVGIKENGSTIPSEYQLGQNYPNPFNPSTVINFALPKSENVSLKVFDVLGREVSTLVNGQLNAGSYKYEFDGKNLSSGIYFYQIQAGSFSETRKMLLTK